ncbi:MAG: nucleotidyl transferase AbiEii/AbiGii toxin family protein [Acidimicrobiia bacterium]
MSEIPSHLRAVLPASTRAVWLALVGNLPPGAYLVGGTGIAAHLSHRESRDLDFFVGESFDPARLAVSLEQLGRFVATQIEPGTLNCYLEDVKIQFLDATDQHPVQQPQIIGGIPVAGLRDLLASTLEVVGDRGELRDYFDLMVLEQQEGLRVEEGLSVFTERYRPATPEAAVLHIVRGLGYFDDVADDPGLPVGRREIEGYWTSRQPEIVASLGWLTGRGRQQGIERGPELSL